LPVTTDIKQQEKGGKLHEQARTNTTATSISNDNR